MKQIVNIILILVLPFVLFFTTAIILMSVGSDQNHSDLVADILTDGFNFVIMLMCVVSTILIVFLYLILNELKKMNETKKNYNEQINDK